MTDADTLAAKVVGASGPVPVKMPILPEEFWETRDDLTQIRKAAHHQFVSADAVLHVVLARIAAMAPPETRLVTPMGDASANYYAALTGPSGSGKSIAVAVARKLVQPPPFRPIRGHEQFIDDVPLGSGEGIAEAYMGTVEEETTNEKGRPRTHKVRCKVRSNVFIYGDEGEALVKALERTGATIGEGLRRGWIGETLGQRNGTDERTRIIPRGSYSLGMVIGFQPETVAPLLADAGVGTPQRFVYGTVIDPALPSDPPDWPGELKVPFPVLVEEDRGRLEIAYADQIRRDLIAGRLATGRGEYVPAELDSHEPLTLVKVSGLLAILDGRRIVTTEDWALARIVWDTSCAVRDTLVALAREQAEQAEQARTNAEVRIHRAIDEDTDERTVAAAGRSVGRRIHNHAVTHTDGCCTRRCVTQSIAGKHRHLVSVSQVIERLIAADVIVEVSPDRFKPGSRSS